MVVRRLPVVTLICCAALAGCGDDEPESPAVQTAAPPAESAGTEQRAPTTATTETSPAPPAAEQEGAEGAGTQPPSGGCGQAAGLDVEVVQGNVQCSEALAAVEGYDFDGAKVQEVAGFVCEAGEAAVRPLVLTCVSPAGEIAARAGSG